MTDKHRDVVLLAAQLSGLKGLDLRHYTAGADAWNTAIAWAAEDACAQLGVEWPDAPEDYGPILSDINAILDPYGLAPNVSPA